MTFSEYLKNNESNLDTKEAAKITFDYEVLSFSDFVKLYHKAVKKGLTSDNAAEVFMKKFNVDFDFTLDAKAEGLSVADWVCKHNCALI